MSLPCYGAAPPHCCLTAVASPSRPVPSRRGWDTLAPRSLLLVPPPWMPLCSKRHGGAAASTTGWHPDFPPPSHVLIWSPPARSGCDKQKKKRPDLGQVARSGHNRIWSVGSQTRPLMAGWGRWRAVHGRLVRRQRFFFNNRSRLSL